jgi:murein DD-endopeptidase MepM/ murein hydrolase activator NlpD
VIDIGFPLRSDTDYHYRDNWLDRRAGPPDPYNHARPGPDGTLIRLHDGIDIYAPENEPVLSPFDGTVIDPATRWMPWEPDRYGLAVVVQSDEPTSMGYAAVLVHLDRDWVAIGQHVTRGQVIGVLGRTGNAEDVRPQLHFELRAPFLIDWSPIGEDRQVDAFNPYPSLVAADPKT